MRNQRHHEGCNRNPRRRRTQELPARRMDQRRKTDGADHGQHPVFGHQRQRAGKAEPQARRHAALLECIEIGQHDQRQRQKLQQIRIVLETLEIEDRIECEHHHDKERAATIDDAQRDQPANHQPRADDRHRQRIGRPVGNRKNPEPGARDPARQRRMLAIAELEFLAPGERLRDVHMDVLRRLQIGQDPRPQHRVRDGKADHEPQPRLGIAGARAQPCGHPVEGKSPIRARGGQK